ncbi:MAG: DNRLRE domain-containing protein [Phycisphaeraceae bacterium]
MLALTRYAPLAALFTAILTVPASGAIVIQPDETASHDVFVYQFGANNNYDTTNNSGFGSTLGAATNSIGHTVHTLIRFDLPALAAADVTAITLNVYSLTSAFGASPSAGTPVNVNAYLPDAAWVEDEATWNNQPAPAGSPVDVVTFNAVDTWFSFDITSVVQAWLDGSVANHGLLLIADNSPAFVAPMFPSSASSQAALRPYLEITLVPEPASAVLILSGAGLLLTRWRRRS